MDKAFAIWSKQGGTGMWAERTPTRSYNGKGDTLQGRAPGGDGDGAWILGRNVLR